MIKEQLLIDYRLLQKQKNWLSYSFDECQEIGLEKELSIDEFGKFETLCSRYSRTIDFLIRKLYRTLDAYEFENQGTLIDVVNNAHKRGLFESIEELRLMKDIRNTIVHEYIEEKLNEVFDEVLEYSQVLLKIVDNTLKYIQELKLEKI